MRGKALLSAACPSSLHAGVFLVCCFVFPNNIRFSEEGIAGIFVILGLVLASFNPHLGARTLGAAFLTTLALPTIIAGVVVGLAATCPC